MGASSSKNEEKQDVAPPVKVRVCRERGGGCCAQVLSSDRTGLDSADDPTTRLTVTTLRATKMMRMLMMRMMMMMMMMVVVVVVVVVMVVVIVVLSSIVLTLLSLCLFSS